MSILQAVQILGEGPFVDVYIDNGYISRIEPAGAHESRVRILLPGLIDLHTHLREPGGEAAETIASGTRAAANGGYTDVFAMANTNPVTDSVARVEWMRAAAIGTDARVHVVAAATRNQAGTQPVDIEALRAAGVQLFSDDGHCVEDDGVVLRIMQALARHGGVFAQHAQSSSIVGAGVVNENVAEAIGCEGWPVVGEEVVVARDIALARATGAYLHVCHVSSRRSVDMIRAAKLSGVNITAEVTPHHLALLDEDAAHRGPALKVNPPLRSIDDVRALRAALLEGTIDAIGTDHAPHPATSKSLPWADAAFGMTALETALPVVAEALTIGGRTDWRRLADVMSWQPAKIGGLPHTSLEVGGRADLCIVEQSPGATVSVDAHRSKSKNSPFEGYPSGFTVAGTLLGGRRTR